MTVPLTTMWRVLFAAIFLGVANVSTSVAAQTIRLIVVGHTSDRNIGAGVQGSIAEFRALFADAAESLQIPLVETTLTADKFDCRKIKEALTAATAGHDDVIVFYYSGHGYRLKTDTGKFPSFWCGQEAYTNRISLASAAETLREKKPRLLLAFADTCNILMATPDIPVPHAFDRQQRARKQAYQRLLLSHKGEILASSSLPTQPSWYFPAMGAFTEQLLSSIRAQTEPGKSGLWKTVLADATKQIRFQNAAFDPPQWVIQDPQADATQLISP
jgi:hypothetical protein